MDVQVTTIILTTWGSDEWLKRGVEAAARIQGANHLHVSEPRSAGDARNRAVDYFDPPEWLLFLDADDNLAPGYLQAMQAACEHKRQLLTPALKLGDNEAACLTDRDIIHGLNPCPIGTLIHRNMFEEAGRFWDEPAWEDFAMFQRAVLVGAEIRFVPEAVYIASHNPKGRNSTVRNPKRLLERIRIDNRLWLGLQ